MPAYSIKTEMKRKTENYNNEGWWIHVGPWLWDYEHVCVRWFDLSKNVRGNCSICWVVYTSTHFHIHLRWMYPCMATECYRFAININVYHVSFTRLHTYNMSSSSDLYVEKRIRFTFHRSTHTERERERDAQTHTPTANKINALNIEINQHALLIQMIRNLNLIRCNLVFVFPGIQYRLTPWKTWQMCVSLVGRLAHNSAIWGCVCVVNTKQC